MSSGSKNYHEAENADQETAPATVDNTPEVSAGKMTSFGSGNQGNKFFRNYANKYNNNFRYKRYNNNSNYGSGNGNGSGNGGGSGSGNGNGNGSGSGSNSFKYGKGWKNHSQNFYYEEKGGEVPFNFSSSAAGGTFSGSADEISFKDDDNVYLTKLINTFSSNFSNANSSPSTLSDRENAAASALIKEYGKRGDVNSCWGVWKDLANKESEGVRPNEITLGCMIDALVSNKQVHHAELLVNYWKGTLPPNTVIYSTLIHGWAKQKDAKRAMNIFALMKKENVACNAVTYNCLIHACVKVHDMVGALEILGAMKQPNSKEGSEVKPDKFTYSTIIKGYCAKGEMEYALRLFDNMIKENLSPDLVIYNTLLDGCVKKRFHDTCDKLLYDMTEYWQIHPNSYTLSILIKRYGRQGDLRKAFALVEELPKKYSFRANAHVWTCLISACLAHNKLAAAETVFSAMCGNPYEISALGGYASFLSVQCQPDSKTYETLITGLNKFGFPQRASELVLEGLRKFGSQLSQDVIVSTLTLMNSYGLAVKDELQMAIKKSHPTAPEVIYDNSLSNYNMQFGISSMVDTGNNYFCGNVENDEIFASMNNLMENNGSNNVYFS